jgi:hypothetical protein
METQKRFAGVNTNVQIGAVTLHVQTENFPLKSMLITNVYFEGTCIHSVKWSYSDHVGKAQFETKLQKAAELQQRGVVQRVPEIWAARNAPQLTENSVSESPISEVRATNSQVELPEAVLERIDHLYLLAMRLMKSNPKAAEMTLWEILSLNPNHKLTQLKLGLLLSIAA